MIISYVHHNKTVSVEAENYQKHRERCLCYKCSKFHPGEDNNCQIAETLYNFDKLAGVTTPVFECAEFACQHETVLTTKGQVNPVDGYDNLEDILVCIRCGKEIKTVEQVEEENEDFTEVF